MRGTIQSANVVGRSHAPPLSFWTDSKTHGKQSGRHPGARHRALLRERLVPLCTVAHTLARFSCCVVRDGADGTAPPPRTIRLRTPDAEDDALMAWYALLKGAQRACRPWPVALVVISDDQAATALVDVFFAALHTVVDERGLSEPADRPTLRFTVTPVTMDALHLLGEMLDADSPHLPSELTMSALIDIVRWFAAEPSSHGRDGGGPTTPVDVPDPMRADPAMRPPSMVIPIRHPQPPGSRPIIIPPMRDADPLMDARPGTPLSDPMRADPEWRLPRPSSDPAAGLRPSGRPLSGVPSGGRPLPGVPSGVPPVAGTTGPAQPVHHCHVWLGLDEGGDAWPFQPHLDGVGPMRRHVYRAVHKRETLSYQR